MLRRFVLLLVVFATGCQSSRWAKSDPAYAAKYPQHTDNLKQTVKQAIDARHLEGQSGSFLGATSRDDPFALGAQAGAFIYAPRGRGMVEAHGGLAGLIIEGDQGVSGGLNGGVRLQSPSRLAPFVGIGGYAGWVPDLLVSDDGLDNNGNGLIDEAGEENNDFVGTIYPEAGLHFWLTPRCRLTASASQNFTTINSRSDFTLYGISIAWLNQKTSTHYVPPAVTSTPRPSVASETMPDSTPWSPPAIKADALAKNPYAALFDYDEANPLR